MGRPFKRLAMHCKMLLSTSVCSLSSRFQIEENLRLQAFRFPDTYYARSMQLQLMPTNKLLPPSLCLLSECDKLKHCLIYICNWVHYEYPSVKLLLF